MLFLAPLVRGGNRQVAAVGLLAIGLTIVAIAIATTSFDLTRGRKWRPEQQQPVLWLAGVLIVLAAPLWLGLMQLAPIVVDTWVHLPGRERYVEFLLRLSLPRPDYLPLSLNPGATWAAVWSAVPVSAAMLAALLVSERYVIRLFGVVAAVTIIQMLIAVAQYVQGVDSFLYFDSEFSELRFLGTFNARNHLAILLGMTVPLWFALLAKMRSDTGGWLKSVLTPFWYLVGFGILLLLLVMQSRGGLLAAIVALILGCAVSIVHTGNRLIFRQWLLLLFGVLIIVGGAYLSAGGDRVTERFAQDALRNDAELRNLFSWSTLEAAQVFWPWGSGAGTFESAFPRFQNIASVGTVPYAHNDYVQLLMEFGLSSVILSLILLTLVLNQTLCLIRLLFLRRRRWADAEFRQVLAGVGVLAFLLHCWVEFNMHIPALAILAAFLMGIFLRPLSHRRL